MNDKKICFISCVNNKTVYEECLYYINNLYIPDGYEIEVISVEDASSMASGYNKAMESSDAKYKVYLHQDTFIVNQNFLLDILYIFKNKEIGMIGVVGSKTIPTSVVWWESSNCCGQVYETSTGEINLLSFNSFERRYEEVKAIDGLIMITQYDIPWREEVFDGWHFYDISQCLEFYNNGYKLVIPKQERVWCVHDCGVKAFHNNFEIYKNLVMEVYKEEVFPLVSILIPTYNRPEYLRVALESAINQTYKNTEIIICDDSTNYETELMLKEQYLDVYKNIRYYRNEKKLGQFDNDIKLLEVSCGEYINFLMDDDVFQLNKIERMMDFFINDTNEQISLVTSNRNIIDENGNVNGSFITDEVFKGKDVINIGGGELIRFVLTNNYNIIGEPTTALFRKSRLKEKFGYYKGRKYICNVDQASWFTLLEEGNAVIIKECLSSFRIHSEQQLASEKMLIGGAEDYTFSILNNNNKVFKGHKEYLVALNRCKNYNINLITKVGSNDKIKNNINTLQKMIDTIETKVNQNYYGLYNLGENSTIESGVEVIAPEGVSVGNNVIIHKNCTFMIPFNNIEDEPRIIIKDGCDIGRRCFVSATNKIIIENNVIIASNVHITDHNHEYRRVGIPIMHQGVTSFTNKVVIGQGSWIGNGCVIVGNVKIGRGCTIGANSLVTDDVIDYCVVAGTPAKVIKYYNKFTGEWIRNINEQEFTNYKEKLLNKRPILTIGIPTYNRAKFLEKCLIDLCNQVGNYSDVEILVCDNNSTDNTKSVVEKYKKLYSNIAYFKNHENIGAMRNVHKVLEIAKGEFINVHGDDDYYNNGMINYILNMIYENRKCSVLYTNHKNVNLNIKKGYGINEYIKDVSFVTTFITGLIVNSDQYKAISDKYKYLYSNINQVYIQMELLKSNPDYCILEGSIFRSDSGQHKPDGYNFVEVFMQNYLDILCEFQEIGLESETLTHEKYYLLDRMIIPWLVKIKNEKISLDTKGVFEIYKEKYSSEPYYYEKLLQIEKIVEK